MEKRGHAARLGAQSRHNHLVVSSCNTIMMAAAELIYLNTLYMFCALTCAGIETLVKTRPKQFKKISKKSASVEFTFTVWTCLYIATLLCVLWQMAFQTPSPDIKYLCSWFSIVQFAFFSTFLLSYVACFNSVSKVICEIFFSHHKCYRMDSCYGLSLRWTRGCRISRFAAFYCSYSSCGCCIIS